MINVPDPFTLSVVCMTTDATPSDWGGKLAMLFRAFVTKS